MTFNRASDGMYGDSFAYKALQKDMKIAFPNYKYLKSIASNFMLPYLKYGYSLNTTNDLKDKVNKLENICNSDQLFENHISNLNCKGI